MSRRDSKNKRPKSARILSCKELKYIPDEEELLSSKEWLKKYGLKALNLNLEHLMSSHKHSSQYIKITGHRVGAKYCDVFPKVNIRGEKMHMELHHHELVQYEENLDKVISRYLKRWNWLLLGPHRVFGTILEDSITLCIDTSGSMITVINELKRELLALMWTILLPNKIWFNLIDFSQSVIKFKDSVVEPTESICQEAADFINNITANGGTCTLEAVTEALLDEFSQAVYLVTDGKPDTSCRSVIAEVKSSKTKQKIHTISLNITNTDAISFLKRLSKITNGRYHAIVEGFDGNIITHQLLNDIPASLQSDEKKTLQIPQYSGDDLSLLSKTIRRARKFMVNSQQYRDLLAEHSGTKTMSDMKIQGDEVIPRPDPALHSVYGI